MENGGSFCDPNGSSVVQVTESNFDSVLASNELVFMFCYAEGYTREGSTRLMPIIFENAAKEITKARLGLGKLVMAKLDCQKEESIRTKYDMCIYYPTFKLFRNGLPSKYCYGGKHTTEALVEFIKEQLVDPIIPFSNLNELHGLNEGMGHIIAYLDSKDQPEYDVLRKVAMSLMESYRFYVKFVDSAQEMQRTGQLSVVFRSTTGTPVELDETYHGSLLSFSDILVWVKHTCLPLLLELTSENEERIRNQYGIYFVLIHMPSDTQSLKKYKELIRRVSGPEKRQFKFAIADGTRFQQLLARFNKSTSDLPLVAFDHYYRVTLFDFNAIEKSGKFNDIINQATLGDFYHQGIHVCRLIDDTEEEYCIAGLFE